MMNLTPELALFALGYSVTTYVLLLIMIIKLAKSGDSSVSIVITALWAGTVMPISCIVLLLISAAGLVT